MKYEKNIWHNPLMNRIEDALEEAFNEINALKEKIDALKIGKSNNSRNKIDTN